MRYLIELFIFSSAFCSIASFPAQTYSTVISDREIYEFYNWLNQHEERDGDEPKRGARKVSENILAWDSTFFIPQDTLLINGQVELDPFGAYLYKSLRGVDTLFGNEDREFHNQQFHAIHDTVWHDKFKKSKLLKRKHQAVPNRWYYSIPLFSLDRKYVIVHRVYYCGTLCAHGMCYVYERRDDGSWEPIRVVFSWIS
jgi:hypothetical protein